MKRRFKRRLKNHGARLLPGHRGSARPVNPPPAPVKTPAAIPSATAPAPAAKSPEEQIAHTIMGIKDPAKRRLAVNHLPILMMISKGKDEHEAALFFVIDELVADVRKQWGSGWNPLPPEQAAKEAKRNSLREVYSRVQNLLTHVDDERAYFYEPNLAAMASRRRELMRDQIRAYSKICKDLLKIRKRYLMERLDTATDELIWLERDIALVTGFAVGIRAAQEDLSENLDTKRREQFERFSIAFPAEPKVDDTKAASGE